MVQTAAVLVLEADFDEVAHGYRPKRSALDTIPHSASMTSEARRIGDGKMLRLVKLWLKAPVVETDEHAHRRVSGGTKGTQGTPQGGVASGSGSV